VYKSARQASTHERINVNVNYLKISKKHRQPHKTPSRPRATESLFLTCVLDTAANGVRVMFAEQVESIGALLHASLKDDDDIPKQVESLNCTVNWLRHIFIRA